MTVLRPLAFALAVFVSLVAIADVVFAAAFPSAPRLSENFSSAFVRLELARLRARPPETLVLGDSVLWGYDVSAAEAVPALLERRGIRVANFAYQGGSPVNTYATLRAILASGVRPASVVFNVNQKTFNPADSAYSVVHPAMWELARPHFRASDARLVTTPEDAQTLDARLDRGIARYWQLYAMRSDLRETLFGDVDAGHALDAALERASGADARRRAAHHASPSDFEGTYDLTPLDDSNVSVHFLERTITLLAAEHIPAIAILTPTNHTLLHGYVDVPEYAANLAYVRRLLVRGGVHVIDADRAFGPGDFFDNDHLTAAASARLATRVARELART